ncbi:hypothetical protein B0H15DRAFT_175437 [Mycena belliarum]|uniref:Uncharacterized protein n=1 Tax=Mycena belliarum TaxID=1033014 RepID=A0AAD6U7Q9_9AGAR|nr:hypothetical protein B0H15DRAFT_175437 [Mycena belliae]
MSYARSSSLVHFDPFTAVSGRVRAVSRGNLPLLFADPAICQVTVQASSLLPSSSSPSPSPRTHTDKMVLFIATAALSLLALAAASPYPPRDASLRPRTNITDTDPQFPSSPPSCGPCQQNYQAIKLCVSVVPVMANFSSVISNPGSFINVISCACSEPFKSTFPQCIDCFQKTGQEALLNMPNPDAVIDGTNKVCALEAAIFGVGSTSSIVRVGDTTPTAGGGSSTPTNGAARKSLSGLLLGTALLAGVAW